LKIHRKKERSIEGGGGSNSGLKDGVEVPQMIASAVHGRGESASPLLSPYRKKASSQKKNLGRSKASSFHGRDGIRLGSEKVEESRKLVVSADSTVNAKREKHVERKRGRIK